MVGNEVIAAVSLVVAIAGISYVVGYRIGLRDGIKDRKK